MPPDMPARNDTSKEARGLRLDVWLDVACLFKTRSDAQSGCKNGKLSVNGQVAKPDRRLRLGDEIEIGRPFGRKQRIVVRGFADRHVSKVEARALYEDLTPHPGPKRSRRGGWNGCIVRRPRRRARRTSASAERCGR